jgi:hypothetical protein
MQKDFERLFHRAEDHYLIPSEMMALKKHIGLLGKRLETYRYLRDNEAEIFQAVADRLEAATLERVRNSSLVKRSCAENERG